MASTIMPIHDMDPTFMKALNFFLSKEPDSGEKLKQMLDEAISQTLRRNEVKASLGVKPSLKPTPKTKPNVDVKKKEKELSQKRDFDKIKKDLEDLMGQSSGKKIKIESPQDVIIEDTKLIKDSDGKQFDLDMDELPCAVCNNEGQDMNGKKAVECQECHNFFHQDCHTPPISDEDASDPRCVWYCSRCTKNMKKMAKQSKNVTAAKEHKVNAPISLSDTKNKLPSMTPFKRHEVKPSSLTSSGNGQSGSLSGWAALSGKPVPIASKPITKKDLKMKSTKPSAAKSGPKLAVSDAWAEALGAKVPAGSKSPGGKSWSSSKPSGKGSGKSSMFPKAAATSVPVKGGKTKEEGASKRLQMVKKKAANKIQMKKSKG